MHEESHEPDISSIPDSSKELLDTLFAKGGLPANPDAEPGKETETATFKNTLAELEQASGPQLEKDLAFGSASAEDAFKASTPRVLTEEERKEEMARESEEARRREAGEDL